MKKIYWLTALALIIVFGSYQLVIAGPGQGKNNQPGNGQQNRGPISFVQELGLSDDQINKITILIQNNNTSCTALEDKMQASKDKMVLLEWSKDFSPEKVEAIMKEMADTMTQLQLNHEKLQVDIKLVLTTEQLRKYNQILQGPKNGKDQQKQVPMLFGKMNNINYENKSFDFIAKDPQGNEIIFKTTYQEGTKFIRDKQIVKPEDFKNGDEVTIGGRIDPEKKIIEAIMVILGQVQPPKNPGQGRGKN